MRWSVYTPPVLLATHGEFVQTEPPPSFPSTIKLALTLGEGGRQLAVSASEDASTELMMGFHRILSVRTRDRLPLGDYEFRVERNTDGEIVLHTDKAPREARVRCRCLLKRLRHRMGKMMLRWSRRRETDLLLAAPLPSAPPAQHAS